jgi:hypothetical protein
MTERLAGSPDIDALPIGIPFLEPPSVILSSERVHPATKMRMYTVCPRPKPSRCLAQRIAARRIPGMTLPPLAGDAGTSTTILHGSPKPRRLTVCLLRKSDANFAGRSIASNRTVGFPPCTARPYSTLPSHQGTERPIPKAVIRPRRSVAALHPSAASVMRPNARINRMLSAY